MHCEQTINAQLSATYILDADKNPIPEPDGALWGEWFERHMQDRVVEQTNIGGFLVSTVFLGMDHNFLRNGPPILYETMIFDKRES